MKRSVNGNPRRHLTLDETALALQKEEGTEKPLSRERIRQIEKQALMKLRIILEEKGLTFEDLMPDKTTGNNDNELLERFKDD